MNRIIFLISILSSLSLTGLKAQGDFADLSTKERINLAEKEETESATDADFQQMMQAGHELFKGQHYLKAIHTYEKAQDRRPYNVYPKVIIADIELSMKDTLQTLRAAEKAQTQSQKMQPEQKSVKPDTKPVTQTIDETKEERLEKLNNWENEERARRERERAEEKEKDAKPTEVIMEGDVEKLSTADYQKELASKYPSGITENVSKEGNKLIITRVVVKDTIGNEYKKVVHDWGGVFYFKNGEAVTERVWTQETEK